jgi:hypothetical protein
MHNLDVPAIVRRLNLKPTIRIEQGWFVAYLEDQKYVLGKIEAGIRPAVRKALQLCRENRAGEKILYATAQRNHSITLDVRE